MTLNIYIWKTTFTSHKQYLFGSFLSRNAKKTHTDTKYTAIFLTLSEKKRLANLQMQQLQKSFSQVFVSATACFDECFYSM